MLLFDKLAINYIFAKSKCFIVNIFTFMKHNLQNCDKMSTRLSFYIKGAIRWIYFIKYKVWF